MRHGEEFFFLKNLKNRHFRQILDPGKDQEAPKR